MKRVIALGGPFIKVKDPKTLAAWYEKHLGISFNNTTYTMFPFQEADGSPKKGYNVLTFFKEDAEYYAPSSKDVMLNFVVDDAEALMKTLQEEGIELIGQPMTEEYGTFFWILDPEGHKIELWQPPVEYK